MLEPGRWYALQVRSSYEHMSDKILIGKGYETFLPTYAPQAARSAASPRELALFPGYLFCRFVSATVEKIVTTPGVIRIVGAGRVPIPVDDQEIENVRGVIHSGLPRQPWRTLPEGSRIRIESGPMKSVEGVLLSSGTSRRLIITITLLQRAIAVELDPFTSITIVQRAVAALMSCRQRQQPSAPGTMVKSSNMMGHRFTNEGIRN